VATFSAKNQALPTTSWGYDLAGNLTQALGVTIQYDAENRQVAYGATTYVYDGLGNRVEKIDQSNNVTTYVYDAFGHLAAEYGGSASITPGTQYLTVDALGSTRLMMTGAQASERHDFQPFGLEDFGDSGTWRAGVTGYNVDTVRQKFTGQERDNESYLDFFQARYFSGIQGRFTSPDPGNAGAGLGDPQSWNGYAYVSGNPLAFTDPSGLLAQASGGGDSGGGGAGGLIVAGIEAAWAWLTGGSGSNLSTPEGHLSNVAWTPGPEIYPTGLTFYANGNCYGCLPTIPRGPLVAGMWSPTIGEPGTFIVLPRGLGPTVRIFGPNGAPTDIDYHPNHPGIGDPHIHNWQYGVRQKVPEPVPPGSDIPDKPVVPPGAEGPYSPWPRQPTPRIGPAPLGTPSSASPVIVINPCVFKSLLPFLRNLPACGGMMD
jgi:RHS repeat-associated protein